MEPPHVDALIQARAAGSETPFSLKAIFALCLIHFTGDLYTAFLLPLLPVLVEKLSLTLVQAGFITALSRVLAFIIQPSVGYLADRHRTRLFILGGPLIVSIFYPLLGVAPSFGFVLLFTALGAMGTSIFHPTAAGMVPPFAGRQQGLSMSFFGLGGTTAFAVGPLLAAYWVSRYGLEALPWTCIYGLAAVALLLVITPTPLGEELKGLGPIQAVKEALGETWRAMALLWLLMVLRAFVSQSFMTFMPIQLAQKGYTLVSIGGILGVYTAAGALSGLVAGHLSDRIDFKPIFYVTFFLATPALYAFLFLPGQWVYLGSLATGFMVLATLPVSVIMAQELAPRGRSMASSLMMGFAYGTGGFLTPLTGKLAEIYSLPSVLSAVAVIPLLTLFLIHRLPDKIPRG